MDCSPLGSSVHGIQGKNIGVGCHSLLQGFFLTQGSNLGLLIAGKFFTIRATKEPRITFLYSSNWGLPGGARG